MYHRELQHSEQLKPLLSLYIEDTVQKGKLRDCTRLKKMAVQYLEQEIREKHFSSRERQLAKPASGTAAKQWRLRTRDDEEALLSGKSVE